MPRHDRLIDLLGRLKDGALHRAEDLAAEFGVSVRTIYRDMDRLQAAGVPVEGARGVGYRTTGLTTLPPLALSDAELDALNLGIAIISEAPDPELAQAAAQLAEKIDAALPEQLVSDDAAWRIAFSPLSDSARGLSLMPTLRSAIRARQKVALSLRLADGSLDTHQVRPIRLDSFGRVWTLSAWSETTQQRTEFRMDLLEYARALPELFSDIPDEPEPT